MMGALLASGVPPWFMVAHSAGETFEGLQDAGGRPQREASRSAGAVFRIDRGTRLPIGPGSWRLALSSLSNPTRYTPSTLVGGWLPRGMISTEPLKDTVRRVVPKGWVDHPGTWIVACDYTTGRRVVFGREGAPPADLVDAVAASCAIPGFFTPVKIGTREYVDGGMRSTSNLDVLRDEGLDLVICLNPTSSLDPTQAWNPVERVAAVLRNASGRRLGSESRGLRAAGTRVVLIQPVTEDHRTMGPNLMSTRNRNPVIETAIETVSRQLREPEVRDALEDLPLGEPHKVARPPGPPSTWPEVGPVARA
jgi:NTE family protein